MGCDLTKEVYNKPNEHNKIMEELIDYNSSLEFKLQLYTEYEDIDGIILDEFILEQQDLYYSILGSTSALLYGYNKRELYELSFELNNETKRGYLLIFNIIFPSTNNEQKYHELMEKMFDTYKTILK
jgi:hypothetical protein